MHISKFKQGMQVRISSDISKTDERWGSNEEMRELRRTIQTIREVPHPTSLSVTIKNFTWAIEDIEELEVKKIEPHIFHFDPKHLL